jgi:hypothetical protein
MGAPPNEPGDWLLAARAGSREAIGEALESCRRYLLQIAREELDPALLFWKHNVISLVSTALPKTNCGPGCDISCCITF